MIINFGSFLFARNGWVNLSRCCYTLMKDVFHILKDTAAAAAAVVSAFFRLFLLFDIAIL